jgi:hypothetical protein
MERVKIECPCCKGEGVLYLFEEEEKRRVTGWRTSIGQRFPHEPHKVMCCHCMGASTVEQEYKRIELWNE